MTTLERLIRIYSRGERAADGIIHAMGVLFAVTGGTWLLNHVTGLRVVVSVSVYCAGLFAMLVASAAYNLAAEGRAKEWLRRFDHAAIFIMIAATYTPLAVNRIAQPAGYVILGLVWFSASLGIVLKMLFPRRFELVSLALYLGMGWLVVTVIKPLSASVGHADLWLLLAGGLVYSSGVVFYLLERLPYHKAVWHGFVLTAAILHFAAIAGEFAV